ncbi:MAG: dihydroorotase [Hyphomicrobiales bacterium]
MTPTLTQPAAGQRTVLHNARLLDPSAGRDELGGILVEDGAIADIGGHITADTAGAQAGAIDCGGKLAIPGLVDMRVFTGEPGNEHRETLASASEAAAAGGVTTFCCMPDTEPVIDDIALVDFIRRRARDTALVRVHPMAALTKGLNGAEMTEFGLLKEAGAVAVTDGRRCVANARVLRRSMAYARDCDVLVVQHTEEPSLAEGGVMNEGEVSMRLGLASIPSAAEVMMLERDIRLVELTGARYHAAHISCLASLNRIRRAKDKGLPVTCGVSINHLALNENDIGPYRTFFKLSPPLRGEDDRRAMAEGLADGSIDVIVSDHDPQDPDTKRRPFADAAFGAIGLETLLPAALSLAHNEDVPLARLIETMTCAPARLLGLDGGTLAQGRPADVTVIDPHVPWIVTPEQLRSRSKNTPFEDRQFEGRVALTMVAGRIVHRMVDAA